MSETDLRVTVPGLGDSLFGSLEDAEAMLRDMAQIFARSTAPLLGQGKAGSAAPARAVALITVGEDGRVISCNADADTLLGWRSADLKGTAVNELFAGLDGDADPLGTWLETRGPLPRLQARHRNGSLVSIDAGADEIDLGEDRLVVLALRRLLEPSEIEAERIEAEARYRSLIEQIPAVTFMGSLSGDVIELYVSPQIEALLGFSQEEWLSDPFLWFNQLHPDDRDRCNREFARGCQEGGPFRIDFRAMTRSGDIVWIHGEARIVRDEYDRPIFIQGIAYDITDSKRAEETVRAHAEQMKISLAEKEVMLKEIHHRVKNNLQVVSSLLRLQSGYVQDKAALEMFNESRNRIHSMALVHEKLYQSRNLSRVDFGDYVASLMTLLFRSYAPRGDIAVRTEIRDVLVGIDVAVPLGMIINELVSNALKYAFPVGRAGSVRISLHTENGGPHRLSVADDGVGFPGDVDFRNTQTLGMQLVRTLTQQIGGTVELIHGGGTEFRIAFTG